jgi:outer membrane immunogenic protein
MKKPLVVAAAAIALLSAPAFAADMPTKAPLASPYNWAGWYWGLNAGYGWADPTVTETDNPPLLVNIPAAQRKFSFSHAGALAGVQAGYNWQYGRNWLAGLETDFDWANVRGNTSSAFLFGGAFPGAFTASSRTDWLGTLRARLGYLPTDRLLVYGTGGLAYGDVKRSGSILNNFGAPLILSAGAAPVCANNSVCYQGSDSKISVGWTLGGGIEFAGWNNVTFKIEYLYVNLGNGTLNLVPTSAITGTPGSATFKFSDNVYNIVRVGFNVKY